MWPTSWSKSWRIPGLEWTGRWYQPTFRIQLPPRMRCSCRRALTSQIWIIASCTLPGRTLVRTLGLYGRPSPALMFGTSWSTNGSWSLREFYMWNHLWVTDVLSIHAETLNQYSPLSLSIPEAIVRTHHNGECGTISSQCWWELNRVCHQILCHDTCREIVCIYSL